MRYLILIVFLFFTHCATDSGSGDVTTVSIASCTSGIAAQSVYSIHTSNDFTLTLQNTGVGDALGTAIKGIESPYSFKGGSFPGTGGTCGPTIKAGESCTVVMNFSPSTAGLLALPIAVVYVTANTISATGCILTAYSRGIPGSFDTSFGTQGLAGTNFFNADDYGEDVLFSGDGSQTIVGYSSNGGNYDISITRLLSSGAPDVTFGTAGKVVTAFGTGDDYGLTPLPQTDGMFLVAGYASNGTNTDFIALRYLSNGLLDTTFGTFGKSIFSVGSGNDTAVGAVLDPTGNIVVAGYVDGPNNIDIGMIRFNANGVLDTSFFTTGRRIYSIGIGNEFLGGITLDTTGRLVASGWTAAGANFLAFLSRMNSNGTLDTSFSSTGKFTTSFSTDSNWLGKVTSNAEGKVVSVGYFLAPSGDHNLAVLRLNTNGTLDTSFKSSGKLATSWHSGNEKYRAVTIDTDGTILAAGTTLGTAGTTDILVGRYLSDGRVDTSFGTNGYWSTDVFGANLDDCTFQISMLPFQLAILGCGNTTSNGYDIAALRIWR